MAGKADGGRGWRKWVPSPVSIVKVFIALVIIKVINSVVLGTVAAKAPNVGRYWPQIG